jgi:methylthioribose-1-phosphate isomerase
MHLYAALLDGSHIVIEARPSGELTHFRGTRVVDERVQVIPPPLVLVQWVM